MPYYDFIWTDELVEHVAEHGISPEEFEGVVSHPFSKGASDSTGMPTAWGYTHDGRFIMAIYEELDQMTILPVTAYEVPEPR